MQAIRWRPLALFAAALALGLGGPSRAHDGHDHGGHEGGTAEHGGVVAEAQGHRFEVLFEPDGLRVYPRGLQPAGLKGRAYFLMPGAGAYSEPYPLRPLASAPGQPADALGLAVDLSRVPTSGTRVTFQVWPVPDAAKSTAEFTVPFALNEARTINVSRAAQADQAAIDAQKTCPISGKPLGSMGVPIKVSRGDAAVFLCCPGCVEQVKAEPDKFLGAELKVSKATQADRPAIAAQDICPVSGEELGSMGTPIRVTRGDQSVFVCCQGCVKKVRENPDAYLASAPAADDTDGPAAR